jgi:hypothetical protein
MVATNKCLAQSNKSCTGGWATKKRFANEPRVMTALAFAALTSHGFERGLPFCSCSDLPVSGRPGMKPSHGSDEQMFGAK